MIAIKVLCKPETAQKTFNEVRHKLDIDNNESHNIRLSSSCFNNEFTIYLGQGRMTVDDLYININEDDIHKNMKQVIS